MMHEPLNTPDKHPASERSGCCGIQEIISYYTIQMKLISHLGAHNICPLRCSQVELRLAHNLYNILLEEIFCLHAIMRLNVI